MNELHRVSKSRVAAIVRTRNEISVHQARWILMPMLALWVLFAGAGVIFG